MVCLKFTGGALGANDTWTSSSGIWTSSDNTDWSLGRPPQAGDNAYIIDTDGTSQYIIRDITYDYTGSAPTLSTVTVANFGVATNELSITNSGVSLSAQTENVASADSHNGSNGEIFQSASNNDISGSLNVGIYQGDSGLYVLQGGTLAITSESGYESIGCGGTFNQSGGLNTLSPGPTGLHVDGGGTYTLSGILAVLKAGSNEFIGESGAGTFIQTGGTNSIGDPSVDAAGLLELGKNTGSSGYYSLSGDASTGSSLSVVGHEDVGGSGNGTFIQSGGTNTVAQIQGVQGNLDIALGTGGSGIYSLSGTGSLSVSYENDGYAGAGTFIQSGGTHTISGLMRVGANSGASGIYSLSGTGSLSVGGNEDVGDAGSGTFIQSGGTHTVSGSMYLGANTGASGTYSLSRTGSLSVTGSENIGDSGSGNSPGATGVFTQSGGTNDLAETLYVGSYQYDHGTYNLQGGTLAITSSSGSENIGNGGNATFNQTGGTNTFATDASLYIANVGGSGLYSLSAGSLILYGSGGGEYVGNGGNGTITQSGGTSTAGALYVASVGGNGLYSLSGSGSLTTGAEYVGNGDAGTFIQSGGTNTVVGDLNIGAGTGGNGTYSLSGSGVLSVGEIEGIGYSGSGTTGLFTQSGGTHQFDILFFQQGTYNLQGGTLAEAGGSPIAGEYIGLTGSATFNQTGGTNTVGGSAFEIGRDGGNGLYSLSGAGSLSVTGNEFVGYGSAGTFNQSGGTNTAGTLTIAGASGSGLYSLSG
ncbi:MAG: hypothetical protein ABSH08_12270, partial [Tepidisphaeraceae bacterium]